LDMHENRLFYDFANILDYNDMRTKISRLQDDYNSYLRCDIKLNEFMYIRNIIHDYDNI